MAGYLTGVAKLENKVALLFSTAQLLSEEILTNITAIGGVANV